MNQLVLSKSLLFELIIGCSSMSGPVRSMVSGSGFVIASRRVWVPAPESVFSDISFGAGHCRQLSLLVIFL